MWMPRCSLRVVDAGWLIPRGGGTSQVNTLFVRSRDFGWPHFGVLQQRNDVAADGYLWIGIANAGRNASLSRDQGKLSNPCESGSMFLSSSSHCLRVVQCMNSTTSSVFVLTWAHPSARQIRQQVPGLIYGPRHERKGIEAKSGTMVPIETENTGHRLRVD